MRRLVPLLALAVLVAAPAHAAAPAPTPTLYTAPPVDARAYLLEDATTGDVLAQRNADESLPMASITKLMTVRIALQRLKLSQIVRTSKAAASVGESTIDLRAGQAMSVHDLLEGALIQSANDAADALADAAAHGGRAEFIQAMNAEAAQLGLTHTHFVRPDGLDAPGHVSSASDLTRLALLDMRDPRIRSIVRLKSAVLADGQEVSTWNDLLSSFPGVFGVKTGHTDNAGWCEVVAARWRGVTLYATILGSPNRTQRDSDLAALLRFGFAHYGIANVVQPGQPYARVRTAFGRAPVDLVAAHGVSRVVRKGRPLTARIVAPSTVALPVQKGQQYGRIEVREGKRLLARVPLVAAATERRPGALGRIQWYTARALSHLSPF
jgi:D-alanyl-D-alanine carboxypeptidase (penicillin-binding protein 5/6)